MPGPRRFGVCLVVESSLGVGITPHLPHARWTRRPALYSNMLFRWKQARAGIENILYHTVWCFVIIVMEETEFDHCSDQRLLRQIITSERSLHPATARLEYGLLIFTVCYYYLNVYRKTQMLLSQLSNTLVIFGPNQKRFLLGPKMSSTNHMRWVVLDVFGPLGRLSCVTSLEACCHWFVSLEIKVTLMCHIQSYSYS